MNCSDCIVNQVQSDAFLASLTRHSSDKTLPLAGSLELTLRCNLLCKHCYIHPAAANNEMTTREIVTVMDKLADAGVLFLLLTGGEILMRPDFKDIYLHAKKRGFLTILYTNATLVTRDLADFLAMYPPRRIEITVYGNTSETYNNITGSPHAFAQFRSGVHHLTTRKLPVRFKTMILKSNQHEIEAIRQWSEATMGRPFRLDAVVNPRLNGDDDVLEERIAPEDVARLQFGNEEEIERFKRLQLMAAQSQPDNRLFKCGAGIGSVHIDPAGHMHPCMMWRATPYDFLNGDVPGWKQHLAELRRRTLPAQTDCSECHNRFACGNCPATSLLESGIAGKNIDYYCRISKARVTLSAVRDDSVFQHSA